MLMLTYAKEIGHAAVYWTYSKLLPHRTFVFNRARFSYFYHRYNNTSETERCIEIPVVWAFLEAHNARNVLEIGNVLNHYRAFSHTVIDKYERADGVSNVDVQDYAPTEKYDAIVSISTMEHVGWDEHPFEPQKALRCIERLQGMLTPGGRMLISFPIGHNASLDHAISTGTLGCDELQCMKRRGFNSWSTVALPELLSCRLDPPYLQNYPKYRQTRAVVFAYFGALK